MILPSLLLPSWSRPENPNAFKSSSEKNWNTVSDLKHSRTVQTTVTRVPSSGLLYWWKPQCSNWPLPLIIVKNLLIYLSYLSHMQGPGNPPALGDDLPRQTLCGNRGNIFPLGMPPNRTNSRLPPLFGSSSSPLMTTDAAQHPTESSTSSNALVQYSC